MNYPVWDLGFAHGLLIALVAIPHVYVSHFAVGGGLFLVLTETIARRRGDASLLDYAYGHARFFILLTLVFGAISGVGIWFTIGLINPAGTSSLIHAYVWGWAIEWVFFFTEITAALVYYYGWQRLSPTAHLAVGWIYFAAAWLSMVIINGILTFQLTPGEWIQTRGFWDGFFNPTYWPSLFTRTLFALALAGFFALLTAVRIRDPERRDWLMRYSGIWSAVGLAGCAAGSLWWWGSVPESVRALADGNMPFATLVADRLPLTMAILAALVLLGPLAMPKLVRTPTVVVILIVGILLMGGGEWVREAVRKPWVIYDYMYSSGFQKEDVDFLREEGLLANAKWIDGRTRENPMALGEAIFVAACANCHSRTGYNGLASRVRNWSPSHIAAMTARLEYTRRAMPPWIGSGEEAEALAIYLSSLAASGDGMLELEPVDGPALFDRYCSSCHSRDGFRSMRGLVEGLDADDLDEYMTDMESDQMPPFPGDDVERRMLAEWLAELGAMQTAETALQTGAAR